MRERKQSHKTEGEGSGSAVPQTEAAFVSPPKRPSNRNLISPATPLVSQGEGVLVKAIACFPNKNRPWKGGTPWACSSCRVTPSTGSPWESGSVNKLGDILMVTAAMQQIYSGLRPLRPLFYLITGQKPWMESARRIWPAGSQGTNKGCLSEPRDASSHRSSKLTQNAILLSFFSVI